MNSFLHLLAKDLIQKYSYNFDNLTILFPNKRAGLFLAQELAQLIDRPVAVSGAQKAALQNSKHLFTSIYYIILEPAAQVHNKIY